MDFQWWQILILTIFAGYQILDEIQVNSSLNQPAFVGFFAGLIMGDVTAGLFVGASMQLVVLGVGTFGGASKIDAASGTLLATAFAASGAMSSEQAIAVIAVPVSALMIQTDVLGRFANTFFAHRIDKFIEDMNYKAIERNFLYGAIPWALSRMIPVGLALLFGQGVVTNVASFLNNDVEWLGKGLVLAGAVLPAVGFAILLHYLPVKKHFAYLILGFVVTILFSVLFNNDSVLGGALKDLDSTATFGINVFPMLGVALIGLALAIIHYKRSGNGEAQVAIASASTVEGEIEDDEL